MTNALRVLLLFAGVLVASNQSIFAQASEKTAEKVLNIQLQNAPKSFEPVAEPARVRVDDRSRVRIHLTNLSPLDLCALGNRTPTPTAETNPIESLVTSIAALGGFDFALSRAKKHWVAMKEIEATSAMAQPWPFARDSRFARFLEDQEGFRSEGEQIVQAQVALQTALDGAMRKLLIYSGGDYRGGKWGTFDPEHHAETKAIRDLVQERIASIEDAARQQAKLDEMVGDAADLAKLVVTPANSTEVAVLSRMNKGIGEAKGLMTIINDNNTALKTAQTNLKTALVALVKIHDDFVRRKDQGYVVREGDVLAQDFVLGTDRKATITGTVSCVSALDGKTPTTDNINYSVLYQDIPRLSASAGFLTTFLSKEIVGTTQVAASNAAGFNTVFAITDRARAQVFPMAFVNYRLGHYGTRFWGRTKEDEYAISVSASLGFGINPNSGTNQPEFFAGTALAFNRLMFHPGVHFGRTQTIGGGFVLNTPVPATFTPPVPVTWGYHAAFSIGFSVRVAPY